MSDSEPMIEMTAAVVAAYVGNHKVALADLPQLIATVHGAFTGSPEAMPEEPEVGLTRAQIRKSVTPEAIISFEDGRGFKALRRHLTTLGLTPQSYREKWGLPEDYPMVAAAYSERRSAMAKALGFGKKVAAPDPAAPPPKKARKPRAAKTKAAQGNSTS